jgi:hypothetical protein
MTMSLTRRTFLQSSLMAGLAGTAEATCTRWLLSSGDAVRIGIAGLGASASEHLALFATIPGARIVGLADPEPTRITSAQRQLRELGQSTPTVYRNVDHMLSDHCVEAVAMPNEAGNPANIFRGIVKAGLPLLADFPPVEPPHSYETSLSARTPVHFRLADFMYPATVADLTAWLKRSDCNHGEAHLVISPATTTRELRMAAIVATNALLAASPVPDDKLISWARSNHAQPTIRGTTGVVSLPENSAGIGALHVHLLARSAKDSKLLVQHRAGSMEVVIASQPNATSSLRTVMMFLDGVRRPGSARNLSSSRARLASLLVEGVINRRTLDALRG